MVVTNEDYWWLILDIEDSVTELLLIRVESDLRKRGRVICDTGVIKLITEEFIEILQLYYMTIYWEVIDTR